MSKLDSIAEQFTGNGMDQHHYIEVLDNLQINYQQTDEFLQLSKNDRVLLHDTCNEIRQLIKGVFQAKLQESDLPEFLK